jgi:hypothetical protein
MPANGHANGNTRDIITGVTRMAETLEASVANKGASTTAAAKDGLRVQPSGRPGVERAAGAEAAAPQAPRAETPTGATPGPMSPEMRAKIAELRNRVRLNLGQIVLAMMNLPRYRHQALATSRILCSIR